MSIVRRMVSSLGCVTENLVEMPHAEVQLAAKDLMMKV
jgi:hypothetical protein